MKKAFNLVLTLAVVAITVTACNTGGSGGGLGNPGLRGGTEAGNPRNGPSVTDQDPGQAENPGIVSVTGNVPRMQEIPGFDPNLPNACAGVKVIATNVHTHLETSASVTPSCDFTIPGLRSGDKYMFDIEMPDGTRVRVGFGDDDTPHVRFEGRGVTHDIGKISFYQQGDSYAARAGGSSEGTGGPYYPEGEGEDETEQAGPAEGFGGTEENQGAEEVTNPFTGTYGITEQEEEQGDDKMMIKRDSVIKVIKSLNEIGGAQQPIEDPEDLHEQLR